MEEQYTIGATKMGIPDIVIGTLRYVPMEDITAFELAKIIQLFMVASWAGWDNHYDINEFLVNNKLTRHFEILK